MYKTEENRVTIDVVAGNVAVKKTVELTNIGAFLGLDKNLNNDNVSHRKADVIINFQPANEYYDTIFNKIVYEQSFIVVYEGYKNFGQFGHVGLFEKDIISVNIAENIIIDTEYKIFKLKGSDTFEDPEYTQEDFFIRQLTKEEISENRYEYNGVFYPIFAEDGNTPDDDETSTEATETVAEPAWQGLNKAQLVKEIINSIGSDGVCVGGYADDIEIGTNLSYKSLLVRANALASEALNEKHPDLYSGCTWEQFRASALAALKTKDRSYTNFDKWIASMENVRLGSDRIVGEYDDNHRIVFFFSGKIQEEKGKSVREVPTYYNGYKEDEHNCFRLNKIGNGTECTVERAVLGLYTAYEAIHHGGMMPLTFRGLSANMMDNSGGKLAGDYEINVDYHPHNLEWTSKSTNTSHKESWIKLIQWGRDPVIGGKLGFDSDFVPSFSARKTSLERIIREGSPEDALWWYKILCDTHGLK